MEEECPVKPYNLQNIGKHIHQNSPSQQYGCLGQAYGTRDQVFKPAQAA
jgi:hypothetical protein